ncbi:MAG: hypothetical protein AAF713_04875 [Pseudomonadota bacterium]
MYDRPIDGPLMLFACQIHMMTLATTAMTTATMAAMAAWSRPTELEFEIGDIIIHAPFGQGFTLQADPTTFWLLPTAFGMLPGTPRANQLVSDVTRLQALVETMPDDSAAAEVGDTAEGSRKNEMRRLSRSIDSLTNRRG